MSKSKDVIIIKNNKIVNYYKNHSNLNIETVNLLLIDILEKIEELSSGELTNTITQQILTEMRDQSDKMNIMKEELENMRNNSTNISSSTNNELQQLKDILMRMNDNISNSIINKLYEIKQNYIEDLKIILSNSQNDNINKLTEKIEKENISIIEKTTNVINNILPKNNIDIYNRYETILKEFKLDINENITNTNITTEKINEILDKKYTLLIETIQDRIINNLLSTEDKLSNHVLDLKTMTMINQEKQNRLNDELEEYLNKYKVSSFKGQIGECKLELVLNKLYSDAEIIKTSNKNRSGDFIIKRESKPTILFENKDYVNQVDKDEISKFINDIEQNDCHGIFLSQYSGITNKKNYQIEIHKKNILIYLTFVDYNADKISTAVDIIDDLSKKLTMVNNTSLTEELLEQINNEYSLFANKKETIISNLRESNKKTIALVNELELPNLCNYLSTKFANTKLTNYNCEICNNFIGKSRASLASHKKHCK